MRKVITSTFAFSSIVFAASFATVTKPTPVSEQEYVRINPGYFYNGQTGLCESTGGDFNPFSLKPRTVINSFLNGNLFEIQVDPSVQSFMYTFKDIDKCNVAKNLIVK